MKKIGFTLAEILITLTIIGVVAAVTVPTLIKKTGNQEYISRLQKTYSVFSQATDEIIYEQGNPKLWCTNVNNCYLYYKEKLKASKDCGSGSGCFKQSYRGLNNKEYSTDWNSASYRKLILADGVQVMFANVNSECKGGPHWSGTNNYCVEIYVDVNGVKKPNIFGRDLFVLDLLETGLVPGGCDDSTYCDTSENGQTSASRSGTGCACKIITEDEMNY